MNILYYHISYYHTWVYRVLYFIFGVIEVNSDIMLFSSLLYRPPEARPLLWCHHACLDAHMLHYEEFTFKYT